MFYTALEDYITNLYLTNSIHSPEQLVLEKVAEKLKVPIRYWKYGSETNKKNGKYIIFINKHLTPQQKWQEFGHELCHPLRHVGRQEYLPFPFYEMQERQANSFMYNFCVPTFMLERMEMKSTYHETAILIADSFNVEYGFALNRLEMYLRKRDEFAFYEKMKKEVSSHARTNYL
ncbi:ImmA/IrrE family metallo-endopeptidase [Sediminibacillus massiliensis]|uniref:ImmA/IrrE family metallo-endopeptidase n=1 Tax=Sediminibacillus massiliensis TaxID=1926277 RepID=UPI0015C3878C|nr:ImmA/IrrE family metallo-endopeptidase [Sediminibacillus massiliensis]